jgi:hypothetical protein
MSATPSLTQRASQAWEQASGAATRTDTFLKSILTVEFLDSKGAKIIMAVAFLAFLIAFVFIYFTLETPSNITRRETAAATAMGQYENAKRLGLAETLSKYKQLGESEDALLFTNFWWYTANMGALFYSDMKPMSSMPRVVVSPKAMRLALLGGARCFVLDVWPDLTPGDAQYSPVVQTVEAGSGWKRTSFNAVPLAAILSVLIKEAYESGRESTKGDPIMLYLRFQGVPRRATFDYTARVLQSTIQPYRLDAAYNGCRGQQLIPTQPLTMFAGKVVVASNMTASNSVLGDYINIGPQTGLQVEYDPTYAKSLTAEMTKTAIARIKQNISVVAPNDASNGWDVAGCAALGLHCLALNFGQLSLPAGAPTYNAVQNNQGTEISFNKVSFLLKPVPLRLVPSTIPAPPLPPDFKFNGGNITQPSALATPGF